MSEPPSPREPIPSEKARASRVRYGVLVLLALAALTSYLSRICLSTANTTIQREFGFSNAEMGVVLSAFFVGYMWFQLPTAWLAQRYGARLTLAALNLLVALCSVWTGLANGLATFWWSRFGLGVMQAGLVPCASRGVVEWFPTASRGRASSLISGSMSLGATLATGITAALLPVVGWRGVFFVYAAVSVAWAAAYYAYFRDRPDQHRGVNATELALIRSDRAEERTPESPSSDGAAGSRASSATRGAATAHLLAAMATSASTWLVCSLSWLRGFGAAFFLTWFPAYLEKGHGVKLAETGFLAMLPLAGGVLGALTGGFVVDLVLRRTGSKRLSRSMVSATVLALCGLCTLAAAHASRPAVMVSLLALGYFCFGNGGPAHWAVMMDVSGRHTEVLFGLANMAGNFGAIVCPVVLGRLFDRIEATRGDWNVVLFLFVGIYAAGAICAALIDPNRSAVRRAGG